MLDEPTRGIDVGAKFEIYQLIAELAKKTKGSLFLPKCRNCWGLPTAFW